MEIMETIFLYLHRNHIHKQYLRHDNQQVTVIYDKVSKIFYDIKEKY